MNRKSLADMISTDKKAEGGEGNGLNGKQLLVALTEIVCLFIIIPACVHSFDRFPGLWVRVFVPYARGTQFLLLPA